MSRDDARTSPARDLASRSIAIKTALPGPKAEAMIARAKRSMSPSLIHVYPLMVKRAAGCMVEDVDGNVFLDIQAGVATASTGHCHPAVSAAMTAQSETLIHICGTDFFYPGYGELCERLSDLAAQMSGTTSGARGKTTGAPRSSADAAGDDDRFQTFLTNSGTEGVEAAIKIARHHTGRSQMIAFRGGFHGRSMGSLSLTASKSKYRKGFGALLAGAHHAPYGDADAIERDIFARTAAPEDVAAIFVEPIQGEGGYLVPPPEFLPRLRQICDAHGILLVFDEVQSGMGRTGRMFAAQHFGVVPDVIVLAKGIASGMPLGAMMAKKKFMTWPSGSHGSTCGGNPVCIAAALATLDLLEGGLMENAASVGAALKTRLQRELGNADAVEEVRGIGLMLGVEFRTAAQAEWVADTCYQRGLLVLECGSKAIRISPPLIITPAQANAAADIFIDVCRQAAVAAPARP